MFRRWRRTHGAGESTTATAEPVASPAAAPRFSTPDGLPTCAAPHTVLRFTPDGRVLVCCANDQYALGLVGQDSLREAWDSDERRRVAEALDHLDYSLGCDECGAERAIGNRAGSIEAMWDHLHDPPGPHTYPRRMEFAISNTCNLQCVQCNGDRSSAIRSQREHRPPMASRYDDAFFEELVEFLPHLDYASFAGGEPLLARETRRIFDLLIENQWHPKVDVVTNTTMWDDRVEHYLRALKMDVTLSIDGATRETFESIRVGAAYDECWTNVDRYLAVTREYGGVVTINFCLMPQNWHEFGDLLLRADALDVQVDVIPVTFPHRFDISRLPADELTTVVESLGSQDEQIGPLLGRNRPVWEARLALLRRRLDLTTSSGTAVTIGGVARAAAAVDTPSRLESLRAELRDWAGQDPIVLHLKDGFVEKVESPDWAEPLDPRRWVGWANEVLLADMVDRLGRFRDFEIEADGEVQRASYWFEVAGQRVPFRSYIGDEWVLGACPVALDELAPTLR